MNEFEPDDEILFAYLLGSCDSAEIASIESWLKLGPENVSKLETLRRSIDFLKENEGIFEPPVGLVDRTLAEVDRLHPAIEFAGDHRDEAVVCDADSVQEDSKKVSLTDSTRLDFVWLKRSWMDVLVGSAAAVVTISLIAPSLLQSREVARRETCANNLAGLGMALANFADQEVTHRLPGIEPNGPLAFAGSYAVQLQDRGLLESPAMIWCPSAASAVGYRLRLPTSEEFRGATPLRVRQWQQSAVGTYAYNLGVVENGVSKAPEALNQTLLAYVSDAPIIQGDENFYVVHTGKGVNILYGDGRVAFVRMEDNYDLPDDPFFNRSGVRGAGLDPEDSALGPSYWKPIPVEPKYLHR